MGILITTLSQGLYIVRRDECTIKHVLQCLEDSTYSTNMTKFIVIYLVRSKEEELVKRMNRNIGGIVK